MSAFEIPLPVWIVVPAQNVFPENQINGVSVFICSSPKEHCYDGKITGYLAWRIKTIQRSGAIDRWSSSEGKALIILKKISSFVVVVFFVGFFACKSIWLSKCYFSLLCSLILRSIS